MCSSLDLRRVFGQVRRQLLQKSVLDQFRVSEHVPTGVVGFSRQWIAAMQPRALTAESLRDSLPAAACASAR